MEFTLDAGAGAPAGEGWAEKLAQLTVNDLKILKQLCCEARADRFWRGFNYLADMTGVRRTSVADCMQRLENAGIVRRHHDTRRMVFVEVVPLNIRIICPVTKNFARHSTTVSLRIHTIVSHETKRGS